MHFYNLIPNRLYDHDLRHATKGKKFSYAGLSFKCKVVDVYDGDTLTVVFRYRGKLQQHSVRMLGYDSPEMKPPRSDPDREREITAAKAAKKALADMVCTGTAKIECDAADKYGRILVTLYKEKGYGCFRTSCNINEWMMSNGYGVPYDGGTKRKLNIVGEKCS